MSEEDWQQGFGKSLMVFVNGDELHDLDDDGKRVRDGSFLLLFNAHYEPLDFTIPAASFGETWTVVVDTATEVGERNATFTAGSIARVDARSVIVFDAAVAVYTPAFRRWIHWPSQLNRYCRMLS